MEHITFTTQDGMEIHGLFRGAEQPKSAVVLLHMMPATKESWDAFASALEEKGIATLAIDERGHGESNRKDGQQIDYREFTEEEQQAKRFDVEASVDWLMNTLNLNRSRIAVVGASIGANLALRYALEHSDCPASVALSPGIDYHGVLTEDAIEGLAEEQPVFIAVSDEDTTSALSVKKLEVLPTIGDRTVIHLQDKGHGTTMFEKDEGFMSLVLGWLTSHL